MPVHTGTLVSKPQPVMHEPCGAYMPLSDKVHNRAPRRAHILAARYKFTAVAAQMEKGIGTPQQRTAAGKAWALRQ